MTKRTRKKVTFNKGLLFDTVIAGLIVVNLPKLINNFFPSLFGTTPAQYIEAIVGGAGAYLYGMLMGNSNVANIGIALAGTGIANDYLSPMIAGVGSTPIKPVIGDYAQLQNSQRLALSNYTNNLDAMNYNNFAGAY